MAGELTKYEWELIAKNKLVLKGTDLHISYVEDYSPHAGFVIFKADERISGPLPSLNMAKDHAQWKYETEFSEARNEDLRALGILE